MNRIVVNFTYKDGKLVSDLSNADVARLADGGCPMTGTYTRDDGIKYSLAMTSVDVANNITVFSGISYANNDVICTLIYWSVDSWVMREYKMFNDDQD